MCGILAVLGCSDNSPAKRNRVLELSRRLKHRGPDWSGFHQHGDYFLCHQRLATVNPASGDQPLFNEDYTIAVVVNGEIYNHRELKKSLPNHQFRTGSDCEVFSHLYEEYGESFIDMLDGVFAFVLLDKRDNSFITGRDGLGVAPLYVGWGLNGSICFSSEMKGLNDECEQFECFPPGHFYSSKTGGFHRWYNPPWISSQITPSVPFNPLVLKRALEKAVTKRLMMDAPFGVILSGDLGSSLVASIAARYQAGNQLHTFSVTLEGDEDPRAAREVAQYLGTLHHEFHFTVQDAINAIDDVIYHTETYDVKTIRESAPMFLLSRKIKSLGLKMAITGEGSEAIFGGNTNRKKTTSKEEFHRETCLKVKSLHQYDCLRANKATFAWGLEAEVPFLDKEFINTAMSIDPEWRMIGANEKGMDKWVLRIAFDDDENPYLPKHILFGQEQFNNSSEWINSLKAHAEDHVTSKMMLNARRIFPYNTPATKEAYYYRMIFEKYYPQKSAILTVPAEGQSVAADNAAVVIDSGRSGMNCKISVRGAPEADNSCIEQELMAVASSENILSMILESLALGVHAPEVATHV